MGVSNGPIVPKAEPPLSSQSTRTEIALASPGKTSALEAVTMKSEHHKAHHEHHEAHHELEARHLSGRRRWLKGLLLGAAMGLGASLLIAPQSGRQTRELLRYKGVQLRQMAEQKANETREKAEQLSSDARLQMQTLRQRGRDYVDEQKHRVTRVATAVSQAAKENWRAPEQPAADRTEPQTVMVTPR
jgi:gas vesicle protein